MSFDRLPDNLERGVERFAEAQRISHDEAVLKLIETGLTVSQSAEGTEMTGVGSDAAGARLKRTSQRKASREALANARPETADALIGYLANAPEVAESIRLMAYERRSQTYGHS